jgi:hypothetical protein
LVWLAGLTGVAAATPTQAFAASASRITRDADHALRTLYAAQPKARDLSKRAKAILVFP